MNSFSELRIKAGFSIEEVADFAQRSVRTIYRWENETTESNGLVIKLLQDMIKVKQPKKNGSDFQFIDLFAGIGGLRKPFEEIGGKCIFTSEWDRFSRQTYMANYKCNHNVAGDITQIPAEDIPEHDLLLAGFPCQPFSLAGVSKKNSLGKKHGFLCETQGTLFFDIARIISHHRPKVFLLENVKNLQNHDKGKTFEVIKKTLGKELGYHLSFRVINAKSWLPQHRERIFILGFKEKTDININDIDIPPVSEGPKLKTILHPGDGTEQLDPSDNGRFIDGDGKVLDKYTLSPKLWDYLQAYAEKHRKKGNGFGFGLVGPEDTARTISARYHKDGSEILIKQSGKCPRRLTPREAARLMGYPDNFQIPVSDTQAYRQFGNSVAIPVVSEIAQFIKSYLQQRSTAESVPVKKVQTA